MSDDAEQQNPEDGVVDDPELVPLSDLLDAREQIAALRAEVPCGMCDRAAGRKTTSNALCDACGSAMLKEIAALRAQLEAAKQDRDPDRLARNIELAEALREAGDTPPGGIAS